MLPTILAVLVAAQPTKPTPPEVKFTGPEVRGTSAVMVFDVANPNADPLPYAGYTADSFTPKLPAGAVKPLYKTEYRTKGGEWTEDKLGWCGTGTGAVSIDGKQKGRFDVPIYKEGEWDEARVGVVWFAGGHGKDPQTARSKPVSRKDVKPEK